MLRSRQTSITTPSESVEATNLAAQALIAGDDDDDANNDANNDSNITNDKNNDANTITTATTSLTCNDGDISPPTPLPSPPPPPSSSPPPTITPLLLRATATASLGGILFGYDLGVISTTLPQITQSFSLTASQQSSIVSILYVGGMIGAFVGGTLSDALGRRTVIVMVDGLFVFSAMVLSGGDDWVWVLTGRGLVGMGVAISGIADVAYLHEVGGERWRGVLVSCHEGCISLGFLLSYVVGYLLGGGNDGWRVMFGLAGVIAVLQSVGMMTLPESPAWLMEKGRLEEARMVRRRMGGGDTGGKEGDIEMMRGSDDSQTTLTSTSNERTPPTTTTTTTTTTRLYHVPCPPLARLLHTTLSFLHEMKKHYRQTIITVFLSTVQQFCGHPNVLNYAPEIFQMAGYTSTSSSLAATLILGVVKFLTTIVVICHVEKMSRRTLLLAGMTLISVSLALLTTAFSYNDVTHPHLALAGSIGVVAGYAASFGPLTWLLTSEMFATEVRGRALGLSAVVTYFGASVVSATFLSGQSWLGAGAPFAVYWGVTVSAMGVVWVGVPDTRGKGPERIECEMREMWLWR